MWAGPPFPKNPQRAGAGALPTKGVILAVRMAGLSLTDLPRLGVRPSSSPADICQEMGATDARFTTTPWLKQQTCGRPIDILLGGV
jgi:hypothetical protein